MIVNFIPINRTRDSNKNLFVPNDYAFPFSDQIIGENFIVQYNNAPCHMAKPITLFCNERGVSTLDWSPLSPEKRIIENIWVYMKRKLSICRCGQNMREYNFRNRRSLEGYFIGIRI